MSRLNLTPCEQLILWDFPPSAALLKRLLHETKAKTVHCFGAKYRHVPLDMPLPSFLRAMQRGLHLLLSKAPEGLALETVAVRFATTEDLVLAALLAMNAHAQGQFCIKPTTQILSASSSPAQPLDAWEGQCRDGAASLTLTLVDQLKTQVQQCRQHLLTAPIATLSEGRHS